SDCGRAFDARLVYDERGILADLVEPRMRPLRTPTGGDVPPGEEDAESLATTPDGGWIVGFDERHRLWRYPAGEPPLAGVPSPLLLPPGLEKQEPNRRLQTLVSLEDGRLVAVPEGPSSPGPATIAGAPASPGPATGGVAGGGATREALPSLTLSAGGCTAATPPAPVLCSPPRGSRARTRAPFPADRDPPAPTRPPHARGRRRPHRH